MDTIEREREREMRVEGRAFNCNKLYIDNHNNICHNTLPIKELDMHTNKGQRLSSNIGEVVRIRINPTDMLSLLDLIELLPVPFKESMSLAQTVSMGLSSLLATARTQGLLPEPDHFQYNERMHRFRGKWEGAHKRKLEITKAIGSIGSEFQAPTFTPAQVQQEERPEITPEQLNYFAKLNDVKEAFMENGAGSWSPEQEKEWQHYYALAYPDG